MGGMIQKKIHIVNIEATETLALKLASVITKGDVITFKGNLGAGKTTLIKALIKNLANKNIEVTSPTFNLLHLYETTRGEIWHFDLYRLKNMHEAYELGIEDAFVYGISLIEWPEIITDILPDNRLDIEISFNDKENERVINLSSNSKKWEDFILNKSWDI